MRGALAGLALEQAWRRVEKEEPDRAAGLGQVQCVFHGQVGGSRVAERVPGDRLEGESVNQPDPPEHRSRAVQDRPERRGRRVRVVLGEAQCRCGRADFAAFSVVFTQVGEDPLGVLGLTHAYESVQQQRQRLRH